MPVNRHEPDLDTYWRNLDFTDSFDFCSALRNNGHRDSVCQTAHQAGSIIFGAFWKGSGVEIQYST